MKNLRLKLSVVGIALIITGFFFLISPKTTLYCKTVGEIVIAMLGVLIGLQLVNIYLNFKKGG